MTDHPRATLLDGELTYCEHAPGQGAAAECDVCSVVDCPYSDRIHHPHDGCPSCSFETEDERRMRECDHGIEFDEKEAAGLSAHEVRRRWPRLWGDCPKGCGFSGIGYASGMHFAAGDW